MAELQGTSGASLVLHVDGDDSVRERVADRVGSYGDYAVAAAAALDAVEERLSEESVDCVLVGESLEGGSWREVLDALREVDPDIPVVLYPAEPDAAVASEAARLGVEDYLPQPNADGEELRERIEASIERAAARRQRRAESERYRELMETIPMSVYFKDENGRYVDASRNIREDVERDLEGLTDADLWGDPEDPTGLEAYRDDLRVIETGEPIVGKEERHEVDEGNVWVRSSKFPWHDEDGEVKGLFGFTRNVTGQKAREEELRRKSQRLEQFASFVSHDLRNPINIAQGYLDRAIDSGDQDALEEVDAALDRMSGLVDDLLTTVREGNESKEWIDMREFVQRVWTATETDGASVAIDVPEGTTVGAVPGQLRQLLDNLFRNADEHGGENVTVRVGLTDSGFYVEDDGAGIDEDLREQVFEYGHSEDGTGIGLTITREIAASHGWDVDLVESDDGGARFEFDQVLIRRGEAGSIEPAEVVPIDETADIGDPRRSGHADPGGEEGTWTISAGGEDIWGEFDEHFFAYGTVDGDVRVQARVTDMEAVEEFTKAGLMVRAWPGEGSPLAYVGLTPEHGSETLHRAFQGEDIESQQFHSHGGMPRWFRLDWIDNTVSFQTSLDGESWITLDRQPIAGQDPLSVGLAVCSCEPDETARAVFEDVTAVSLRPVEGGD